MSIKENIREIKSNMSKDVVLVAVSKTRSIEEIKEAYDEGIKDFGENRVQELLEKIDFLPTDINWHLIGHLQTNKVKYIVGRVNLIHSLDSIRLLNEIERQCKIKSCNANVLIQVNIGREESKTGILVEDLESLLSACETCSNIKVLGLMTIIPKGSPESCALYFKRMKALWDDISLRKLKNVEMKYLSMGMTGDYKIAIKEGANMIRIGTGIFGSRK